MIKCNICGAEKATRREMNGHLLRCHYDEYKAAGCRQSAFTTGDPEEGGGSPQRKRRAARTQPASTAPAGFRLLNKNDEAEAEAYTAGYRYIDDDQMCYDAAEAREKGWI